MHNEVTHGKLNEASTAHKKLVASLRTWELIVNLCNTHVWNTMVIEK